MNCDVQSRLLLQFHITGRCNLQCKHCYRTEGNVEPLSYSDVVAVIEQYKELLVEYNCKHRSKRKGHINITGGEPFMRADICDILYYLGNNRETFTYGILSNGSFLDEKMLNVLLETKVSFVQLSIDGNKEMHDFLRAPGDFDRVLRTAEWLEQKGIRTYISFTANRKNYRCLPLVAKECRKRKITKLWSDRIVPIGNGQELQELSIEKDDFADYLKVLKKAKGTRLTRMIYPKTQVVMNRALQSFDKSGDIYSCSAGNNLITVDEFGNVMPCRRMPIICGNVAESKLRDIYYNHETFQQLRINIIPQECTACKFAFQCRGGARCQSYAKTGFCFKKDPACGRIFKR